MKRILLIIFVSFIYSINTYAEFTFIEDINKSEQSHSYPESFIQASGQLFFTAETSKVVNGMIEDPSISLFVTNGLNNEVNELYKLSGEFGTNQILGLLSNQLIFREGNLIKSLLTDTYEISDILILSSDNPLEQYSNLEFMVFNDRLYILHHSDQFSQIHTKLHILEANQNSVISTTKRIDALLNKQYFTPANNNIFMSDGGTLYFAVSVPSVGLEFWQSDGTMDGTVKALDLQDLNIPSESPVLHAHIVNSKIIFESRNNENTAFVIYAYNLLANTFEEISISSDHGQQMFCSASNHEKIYIIESDTRDLYVTDGTILGTKKLQDNVDCPLQNSLTHLFIENKIFLGGSFDLFVSDGTVAGTVAVTGFENSGAKDIGQLAAFNQSVYFSSEGDAFGRELWKLDLSSNVSGRLTDINTFARSSITGGDFSVFNNKLYFTATDGIKGHELWTIEPDNNYEIFNDINTHALNASSHPEVGIVLDDKYLFYANNETNGRELWIADQSLLSASLTDDISVYSYDDDKEGELIGKFKDSAYFYAGVDPGDFRMFKINNDESFQELDLGGSSTCFRDLIATLDGFICSNFEEVLIFNSDGITLEHTFFPECIVFAGMRTCSKLSNTVLIDNDVYFVSNRGDDLADVKLYKADIGSSQLIEVLDLVDTVVPRNYNLFTYDGDLYFELVTAMSREIYKVSQVSNELELIANIEQFLGVIEHGILVAQADGKIVVYDSAGNNLELLSGFSLGDYEIFDETVYLREFSFNPRLIKSDGSIAGTSTILNSVASPTSLFDYYVLGNSFYVSTDMTATGQNGNVLKEINLTTGDVLDHLYEVELNGPIPATPSGLTHDGKGGLFFSMGDNARGTELWNFSDLNVVSTAYSLSLKKGEATRFKPEVYSPSGMYELEVIDFPQKGGVTVIGNELVYSPFSTAESGFDSITYRAKSDGIESNISKVKFFINSLPIAVNDELDLSQSENINPLLNDIDMNDVLVLSNLTIVESPINGELMINENGVMYLPSPEFPGTDSFKYSVLDEKGESSNIASVNVIGQGNTLPASSDDSVTTNFQTAVTINVLGNDTDSDGTLDTSSVVVSTDPSSGAATVLSDGQIRYTPNTGFSGSDTFQYTVQDNNGAVSDPATVTVTVRAQPVTSPPPTSGGSSGGGGGSTSWLVLVFLSLLAVNRRRKIRIR